jgi:hypothetical protein
MLNKDNTKMCMDNNVWGVDGCNIPRIGTNWGFFWSQVKHYLEIHDQLSEEQFRRRKSEVNKSDDPASYWFALVSACIRA